MSELGTATHIREKFRSVEAVASWLGLCPDNRISGGRVLKAGTRKVTHRIANILRMAANALSSEQGRMGEYVRRIKGRLGKAEGIVAGAYTGATEEAAKGIRRSRRPAGPNEPGRASPTRPHHLGADRHRPAL